MIRVQLVSWKRSEDAWAFREEEKLFATRAEAEDWIAADKLAQAQFIDVRTLYDIDEINGADHATDLRDHDDTLHQGSEEGPEGAL